MSYQKGLSCLHPVLINLAGLPNDKKLRVPCGHCFNCKQKKTNEWKARLIMESQYYEPSSLLFVTLTYSDDNLPVNYVRSSQLNVKLKKIYKKIDNQTYEVPTLVRKDLQDFIKRIRSKIAYEEKINNLVPSKFKYYAVGEYGGLYERSHIHIMFFGFPSYFRQYIGYSLAEYISFFVPHKTNSDNRYVAWDKGFVDVKVCHSNSASYIAGYVQKKLYGKDKVNYRSPEFLNCSQGIGNKWFYDHIYLFDNDNISVNIQGFKMPLARYFIKKLQELGVIDKKSLLEIYDLQIQEEIDFSNYLNSIDVSFNDFISNRENLAKHRFDKWNAKRRSNNL